MSLSALRSTAARCRPSGNRIHVPAASRARTGNHTAPIYGWPFRADLSSRHRAFSRKTKYERGRINGPLALRSHEYLVLKDPASKQHTPSPPKRKGAGAEPHASILLRAREPRGACIDVILPKRQNKKSILRKLAAKRKNKNWRDVPTAINTVVEPLGGDEEDEKKRARLSRIDGTVYRVRIRSPAH